MMRRKAVTLFEIKEKLYVPHSSCIIVDKIIKKIERLKGKEK